MRSLDKIPPGDLSAEARKLLTFVDNRQDASLQAGHFNDFVQVAQLRGAVYRALQSGSLHHEDVAQRAVESLGLRFEDYAANPEAVYGARSSAERAFKEVIEYRLYTDLQRGWRVTMPNLEQTGLLVVEYESLPEIAADTALWEPAYEPLRNATAIQREELCQILLDEFRRDLAIDIDCLTDDGFERVKRQSGQHLQRTVVDSAARASAPASGGVHRGRQAGRPAVDRPPDRADRARTVPPRVQRAHPRRRADGHRRLPQGDRRPAQGS